MTALLYRKEMLALGRDGRALLAALALLALFALVLAVSVQDHARQRLDKERVGATVREQWDKQGVKHPHRGAHFGMYVFRPESVLASFDPGIHPHAGQVLWLEPHRRNAARFSQAEDDQVSQRFGGFTPAFLLTAIVPLLLIGLCFGAVAQERESGTLRMSSGAGMKGHSFLLSKFLALLSLCALVVGLLFGAVLLLAALAGEGGGTALRAVLLALSYLAYYAVIIALALAVSSAAPTGRHALMLLLGVWIAFVFVAPRLASAAAGRAVSLPPAEQFWAAIRHDVEHGLPGDGDLAARSKRFDESLLKRHGVSRLEDLPVGANALRRLDRDGYADRINELHFHALWRRFEQQQTVVDSMAMLSPMLAMRSASMALAGTDLSHQRAFEEAAESYRRYFNQKVDGWDAEHSKGMSSYDDPYASDRLWQSVAHFNYQLPPPRHALRAALPGLAGLALWLLAAALILTYCARRLRP